MHNEKEYNYIGLNMAQKLLQNVYGIETEKMPYLHFRDILEGMENINNKEYRLHIKTGNNYLFLINGSVLIIRSDNDREIPDLKHIEIVEPSQAITYIPLLKFDKGYGTGITYLISDYYRLKTGDVIKVGFESETENPKFIFTNILRTK